MYQRRLLPQKELLFLFLPLGYYQLLYEATKSKVQFPLPQIDMFFFVEHQIHRYRTKVSPLVVIVYRHLRDVANTALRAE